MFLFSSLFDDTAYHITLIKTPESANNGQSYVNGLFSPDRRYHH